MTDINIRAGDAMVAMRATSRRGAYGVAADFGDQLPVDLRCRPELVLERVRLRIQQGHMIAAEKTLAELDRSTLGDDERIGFDLEQASLELFRHLRVDKAVTAARRAVRTLDRVDIVLADRAAAEVAAAKVFSAAATFRVISADRHRDILERLPRLAESLEAHERFDEAFAARLMPLRFEDDPQTLIDRITEYVRIALDTNRPEWAAAAHVTLAERLLVRNGARQVIASALDNAESLYDSCDHVTGPIEVREYRARASVRFDSGSTDELESCIDDYGHLDAPRAIIGTLLQLSQIAHERGDIEAASGYHDRLANLAVSTGLGMIRVQSDLAQADFYTRNGAYRKTIEVCERALNAPRPRFLHAAFAQQLGSAYAFVADHEASVRHNRRAIDDFLAVEAEDMASTVVTTLISNLEAMGSSHRAEVDTLLATWLERDERRGDSVAAVVKREIQADIALRRYANSANDEELVRAARALDAAEKQLTRLPEPERRRRAGNLAQARGRLELVRGDENAAVAAWRSASEHFEAIQLAMEAANCHYILGTIHLNRSNVDISHFEEAETHLAQALRYYDTATMRGQAGDTRTMLAQLYVNTSVRTNGDLRERMIDAALEHLQIAEADFDAMRRDYSAQQRAEAERGKRGLVEKSRKVYELILDIYSKHRPNPTCAWIWVQHGKARGLGDLIASGDPRDLGRRHHRLDDTRRASVAIPDGRRHLDEAVGHPADATRLRRRTTARDENANVFAVDWYAVGNELRLVVLPPTGAPVVRSVPLTLDSVKHFVAQSMSRRSFRMTLHDCPEILAELNPLIAPLADLVAPDDHLVLCPTGPLGRIPLHALEVDGGPLIERNPVSFTPSLGVLERLLNHIDDHDQKPSAGVFGDADGDRPAATAMARALAARFETDAVIGQDVTRDAVRFALEHRDMVHFQSHARHDADNPLESRLQLADGDLIAREILEFDLRADLVVLAACESSTQASAPGDEPLGLVSSLLCAGARSILASLWPVNDESTAVLMHRFHEMWSESSNKAQALRTAILEVRNQPNYSTPYHWAPFILHGNWTRIERSGTAGGEKEEAETT